MSGTVVAASIAAWNDEAHVRENRAEYAAKFARLQPRVTQVLPCAMPEAAFYLWAATPIDDTEFARRLFAEENVAVLPGSLLAARDARRQSRPRPHPHRAGGRRAECAEGVDRIVAFARAPLAPIPVRPAVAGDASSAPATPRRRSARPAPRVPRIPRHDHRPAPPPPPPFAPPLARGSAFAGRRCS